MDDKKGYIVNSLQRASSLLEAILDGCFLEICIAKERSFIYFLFSLHNSIVEEEGFEHWVFPLNALYLVSYTLKKKSTKMWEIS